MPTIVVCMLLSALVLTATQVAFAAAPVSPAEVGLSVDLGDSAGSLDRGRVSEGWCAGDWVGDAGSARVAQADYRVLYEVLYATPPADAVTVESLPERWYRIASLNGAGFAGMMSKAVGAGIRVAPQLTNPADDAPDPQTDPNLIAQPTWVTFTVTYTDADGDLPTTKKLLHVHKDDHTLGTPITGSPFTMTTTETPLDVTDGADYSYGPVPLDRPGVYYYYFEFQNATDPAVRSPQATAIPDYHGPIRITRDLVLSTLPPPYDNGADPDDGDADPTTVTFRVKYADLDGEAPTLFEMRIFTNPDLAPGHAWGPGNGSPATPGVYEMTKIAGEYAVGATYSVTLDLDSPGYYYFYFLFDNLTLVPDVQPPDIAMRLPGPSATPDYMQVIVVNQPPELYDQSLDPNEDVQANPFEFKVTYRDDDDNAPSDGGVLLWVHNNETGADASFLMAVDATAPAALQDSDYTNGERYTVTVYGVKPGDKEIFDGDHTYYFEASDDTETVYLPLGTGGAPPTTTQQFVGPKVNDAPNEVASGFDPATTVPLTVVDDPQPTITWNAATDPNATDPANTLSYRVEFSDDGTTWPEGDLGHPLGGYMVTVTPPLPAPLSAQPLVALPSGTWWYRVITIDNNLPDGYESVDSGTYHQQFKINAVPELSNGSVTPAFPTAQLQANNCHFEVTYTDTDWVPADPAPDYVNVIVTATTPDPDLTYAPFAMAVVSGAPDYSAGEVFAVDLKGVPDIGDGDHTFYFEASDGTDTAQLYAAPPAVEFEGPKVNDPPNAVDHTTYSFDPADPVDPTMTHVRQPDIDWDAATDPNSTDTPDTLTYRLEFSLYNDHWGAPEFAPYTVDNILPGAWPVQPTQPLPDGEWYYWAFVIDDDGEESGDPTPANVPSFTVQQMPCELELPPRGDGLFGAADYDDGLHPATGGEGDDFTFVVKYKDADNDPPNSDDIDVVVTNTTTTTTYTFPLSIDVRAPEYSGLGEDFFVTVQGSDIGDGEHTFYFRANDEHHVAPGEETLLPSGAPSVQYSGPTVNDPPNPPTTGFDPTGGVVVDTTRLPDISWDAASDPNATDPATTLSYRVEFSGPDVTPFTINPAKTVTIGPGVTTTPPAEDLENGTWEWRVITIDDSAEESTPSAVQTFDVLVSEAPQLALLAAPYDNGSDPDAGTLDTDVTFRIEYTDLDGDLPTTKNLEIYTDSTLGTAYDESVGSTNPYDMTKVGGDETTGAVYQKTLNLRAGASYYFYFDFAAPDGSAREPSAPLSYLGPVTITAPCTLAAAAAPYDNGSDPDTGSDDPTLVTFRVEYTDLDNDAPTTSDLEIYTDAGLTTAYTGSPFNMSVISGAPDYTTGEEFQAAVGLATGASYYFYFDFADPDGSAREPSAPLPYLGPITIGVNSDPLTPQPATGYIPADAATIRDTTPLLRWPAATDPDPLDTPGTLHYEVQVDDNTDFGSPLIDAVTAEGVTLYQVLSAEALPRNTLLYWHVRTVDDEPPPNVGISEWTELELALVQPLSFTVTLNSVLSDGTSSPLYGDLTTLFRFSVVYTDSDDLGPSDPIQLVIMDQTPAIVLVVDMLRDPADPDAFTDGVTYLASVRGSDLGYGAYDHYFRIADTSIQDPVAPGTYPGPIVGSGSALRFTDAAWSDVAGYEEGDTAYVELTDADENENSGAAETVWVNVSEDTSSDSEWLFLTETGNDTGVFRGQIDTLGAAGSAGDGTLNVISGSDGNVITVTYDDPDGGGDSSSDTALVTDTVPPAPLAAGELTVTLSADGVTAILNWSAYDEAAQIDVAGYSIYQDTATFADTTGMTRVRTVGAGTQTTTITGLTVGVAYFFAVGPFDSVPNEDPIVNDATGGTTTDTNPPYLENEAPAPGAVGVPFDTDVVFDISDDGSGVDQSTIVVEVNGVDVTADCTIAAKGDAHVGVSYDPTVDFGYNQTVTVHVVASDDSGNPMDATYQFDTVTDTQAPQVTQKDFSATEGWVSFHLTDDISGVDTPTIAFTIGGIDVTADCTIDDTDPLDVSVLYTATAGWAYNVQITFSVDASDVAGNAMATDTWQEQSRTDDTGPEIDQFNPADGATDVSVATDISCRVRDSDSGVDQSSVTMTVEGEDVTGDLVFKALDDKGVASLEVTYTPAEDLPWETEINVHVEAADDVGNTATEDWSFTTEAEPTFAISGETTDASGDPLVGVQVTVDGHSVLSDGNGVYRVTGLLAGTYTVTPTKDEYDFTPTSSQQTVGPAQQHVDFVGTLRTYSISGNVSVAGTGLANVTVKVEPGGYEGTTDENGDYTVEGMPNETYSVTCQEDLDGDGYSDYRYTPASQTVNVEGAAVADVDFTAAPTTYTVSGTISDSSGGRIAGVTVTAAEVGAAAAGKQVSAVTNEAGRYTISGVTAGTVELTPAKSGLAFDPETLRATVPPDSTGNDFVAYTEFTHSFPAGLNMLGVPCTPPAGRQGAVDVFDTESVARWDVAASPPQYVAGEDNPGHPEMQVRPGAGFFVNFAAATDLVVPGDPVSGGGTFSLSLSVGWNMVANMYETALPLLNINAVAGGEIRPFAFVYDNANGSYLMVSREPALNAARNYLEAWEGAWFRAVGTGTSVIVTEPGAVASAALVSGADASTKVAEGGWLVPIVARAAGRADLTTLAGIGSSNEASGYVVHNPPRAPSSVDVYFTTKSGQRLAHDVRPQSAGSTVWPFVVETDLRQTAVQVSLPDLSAVPNDLAVYLVDLDAERRMYARTLPSYSFTSGEDGAKRHFELVIEPRGTDNLVIKSASVQTGQAGAIVTYEVSKACQITIEVLNIAGRSIRHLVTDKASPAGRGEQVWNLRSDSGTVAPSGAYLVKIEATADNGQRVHALRTLHVTR